MNRTKKILIGMVIIFVIALFWVGMDAYRNRNLEVKYNNCSFDGEFKYIENSILGVQWKDNNLIVRIRWSYGGCCDENLKPDYYIEKDRIFIMIPETTSNFAGYSCNCHCCYNLDFKLKNLEQKDYKILLYKKRFMDEEFLVDEVFISNAK